MKITLKRLEDAVPEMIEIEFIADNMNMLVSGTLSLEQANDLRAALHKALKEQPISTATYGIDPAIFKDVVNFLRSNQKINAIKLIRDHSGRQMDGSWVLGLKEAKDLADNVDAAIARKGENDARD